uniref:Uncharacterized protein n=1 Tax=Panagrolaimus superbus TaxID=310955 RepID=A0A914YC35_9BILA
MFRHSLSSEPEYCSDHDRESLDTVSIKTMIMVDSNNVEEKKQQPVDSSKVEAIRKLLTEPSRSPFSRESGAYRSYRSEKAKTTDDLDFITDKHNLHDDTGEPSTPSTNSQSALTDMVKLKKEIQFLSLVPEPVAAKIPRPKVSKYNLTAEEASTPDEEEEAADRLTPLRSELRSLAAWSHGGGPFGPAQDIGYRRFAAAQNAAVSRTPIEDDEVVGEIQNSGASSESDSEGTYEMSDKEDAEEIIEFEMSEPLKEALETLNDHLKKPDDVATQAVDWAQRYVQHTWLKMATKRKATAGWVEKFLDALESYEPALIELIVNFADNNGNTALHYAVSHENYDLVSVMLDSKVCNVDNNNIAGYSPVMLGSLCEIHNETQSTIIQRLFEIGNVNAKAIKHGQTALQLAASHGRVETTQLLLNCGADVNIQDVDGSTALMCAAEHGHKEIAKMLLKCSNIDASLTDCDNQTALSIAVQQGHKALAVLIYAHLNFHRYQSSENSSAV